MMLQSLITAFRANQLDPSAEELADAVWFALQIVPLDILLTDTNLPFSDKPSQLPAETTKRQPDANKLQSFDDIPPPKETEGSYLYPWTSPQPVANFIGSRPVRTPAVPMLPDKLSLGRALRPLMRRVSSRNRYLLNEAATVQHLAETKRKVWLPVLKGVPERWLTVTLVIDKSPSMVIWQPTIIELRQFLEGHGAFRDVRTWHLDMSQNNPNEIQLYASGKDYSRPCSPKELIDPTQRNLILVVSDCVSSAWYTGVIAEWLGHWGQHHPVAIIQMLPPRLWSGTALGEVPNVNLYATTSNSVNTRLAIDAADFGWEEEELQGLKIPIVTLEPESLAGWARLVTGKPDAKVPGVLLKPASLDFSGISPAATLSATERLDAFYAAASPQAQKLAGYLAAVPLTLDVMRLIQQVMLPESRQVHLAEVFLGGLLKRHSPPDTPPQQMEYDFHDGVRELLLDSVLVPEVLKVVSEYIERRLGGALDFRALLEDPAGVAGRLEERSRPFAKVAGKVLKRLGGNYGQLVERLEEKRTGKPSVLSDEERKGQLFTFENVFVNHKGDVIRRESGQARQIVIDLGKGVNLEMVYIPAGTFLMGAAPNEAEANSSEYPQHQVTLKSFYMGKYPVTQAQWQAIMGNNPSYFKGENRPVEMVDWEDAKAFCDRLSQHTGQKFRLPSEAEWEYACRAGTTTPFYFDETMTPDLVNYNGDYPYGDAPKDKYREETTPVGSFPPNAFGLYDMHGNVWEWCEDVWHKNYEEAPTDGSVWKTGGNRSYRLLRGGSWNYNAVWCRAAYRTRRAPDSRDYDVGLRVVLCAVWTL